MKLRQFDQGHSSIEEGRVGIPARFHLQDLCSQGLNSQIGVIPDRWQVTILTLDNSTQNYLTFEPKLDT